MKFLETLKLAIAAIMAHKLRSVLTLLGMIIGVTAVVVIVSLIQGFNLYVDEKIAGIGSKSFSIRRFSFEDFKDTDTIALAQRRNPKLNWEDYDYLRSRVTLVDQLAAKIFPYSAQVKRGSETLHEVAIHGATANIFRVENIDIESGRGFTEVENEASLRIAFVGADIAKELFPSGTVIDQEIFIAGIPYNVIGVAAAKGTVFGQPQDRFIIIPFKTFSKVFGTHARQRGLYFVGKAKSDEVFNQAVEETRQLLRVRRQLLTKDKDNFGIVTPDAITGMRDRVFGPIFIVAIVVPGIALVVGGIVIMNIMLVSVTERTKEIGIRKALGARRIDILKQFLVEAITLSAIGGIIGVVIAWITGRVLTEVFFPTHLSILAVVIAVTVSGMVGIVSGIFPAWKAAKLDPIEALRNE
jgi:putative ABC transport system permease protein